MIMCPDMGKTMEKRNLTICLGSSCFARGNKEIVHLIRKFLDAHALNQTVDFRGKHCFGHCEHGPSLRIDQRRIEHISRNNIEEILKQEFLT